ncbi:flagellar hook-associated protein FlgK [Burkholderia sp. WAC0059]|uniref:flagellar hook-associated protein FlgK n=1 Tax=Burkholderia sp. WAC0059 TaxID=2066022 RepID=UPI000C7EB0A0|nr:flagellar hook-associated protein FlgK [Burkholderia sp. WAC0059]PLZ00667.1 flagellar hook-associated protein FlgK [Burkholderia sp. WAC0059]
MGDLYAIGLSGLEAAQLGISTTGNNISNSTTPGYDVESPVYAEASGQYSESGYIGNGVDTTTIQRAYSQFLTTSLNNAQSQNNAASTSYQMAEQLSNLVGSPSSGIASAISSVFTGLQDVADDPSEDSSRQSALGDAQTLADEINSAGEQYDEMRSGINTQLSDAVNQINTYTGQIAQLNTQISEASTQGQAPNQLLDERDQDVSALSQLVGVQVVQNSDGYSLFLSNGQPLVVGSQSFSLSTVPSSANPNEDVVAYDGAANEPDSTPTQLSSSAITGGTVGGLLSFRSTILDPAEAQLGAIATSFASQINSQNELGLTLTGAAGAALFSVGSPTVYANANNTGDASLAVTLSNASSPPTDNYALSYNGTDYTLTDTTTNQVVSSSTNASTAAAAAGLDVTLTGTMNAGDSFTILPTSGALDNFSVTTTDPSAIAAASPVLVSASSSNTGSGEISDVSVSAGYDIPSTATTLTYTAPTTSGGSGSLAGFPAGSTVTVTTPGSSTPTTYTIGANGSSTPPVAYDPSTGATITITDTAAGSLTGVTFTLTGTPAGGDEFTVASNAGGTSDGSNALAMADLASSTTLGGNTLTDAYSNYVNSVGNSTSDLEATSTSSASLVSQLTTSQQSVSGVNLDEEATNLLQYQQLYQANSKVIQTAESLFQTLIGIFQ